MGSDNQPNKMELCGQNSNQTTQNETWGVGDNDSCLRTQCVMEHKVFISATRRFDGGTLTQPSANSLMWV